MSRVIEPFGDPIGVDNATSTAYFAADEPARTALKILYSGDANAGTVRTVVLADACHRNRRRLRRQNPAAPAGAAPPRKLNSGLHGKQSQSSRGPVNIINSPGPIGHVSSVAMFGKLAQFSQRRRSIRG